MKIQRQNPVARQGRLSEITVYLRSTKWGERLIVTHWLDTDTYSASHVTGKPRYEQVPGQVVGRLVPGSLTTIALYGEAELALAMIDSITKEW